MSPTTHKSMTAPTVEIAYVKTIDGKPTLASAFKAVNTASLEAVSYFAAQQIRNGAPKQDKLQVPKNVLVIDTDIHPSIFRAIMHMVNFRRTHPAKFTMARLRVINPDIPANHIAEGATLRILNYLQVDQDLIDPSIRLSLLQRLAQKLDENIVKQILADVYFDKGLSRLGIRRVLAGYDLKTEDAAREFVLWCKEHGCGVEAEAQMAVLVAQWRKQEEAATQT